MARLVHRPIAVEWKQGNPMCFRDGDRLHRVVEVVDGWLEMGDWWNGEGERTVFRVRTEEEGWYDIEGIDDDWFVYRVWD